ncbi:putative membrane protein [Serratia marcescens]|nr:putative membrane protein [Serratia marcescens]
MFIYVVYYYNFVNLCFYFVVLIVFYFVLFIHKNLHIIKILI